MITALKREEDGTIQLTVTLPWELVKKTKEEVILEHVEEVQLPGFRKGKAPRT
jgi:FKBP-type peptidyl-prolyl cis-trans isomerase (trigger factor)